MLSNLVIVNFQSVKSAKLRLGRLTVITGPTGSGKSAAVRAIHLAAFNKRGADFITRGAKEPCKVILASEDEAWAARIERGKTSAKDSYTMNYIVPTPVQDGQGVSGAKYTKLGGAVPPQVTEYLRITELNFARQFDRPFLLDESGSKVAGVLGDLTNVNEVFDAAREGNRQRLEVMKDLRKADKEVETVAGALQEYADLPGQRTAMAAAELQLTAAGVTSGRLERVRALRSGLEKAHAELASQEFIVPVPPSLGLAEDLSARRTGLGLARRRLAAAQEGHAQAEAAAAQASEKAKQAHAKLHDALVAAGKCPMCGQAVNEWTGLATMVSQAQQ